MTSPSCEDFQGPSSLKKSELDPAFLDRELEVAKDVQNAFIPHSPPPIPGLICEAFYKPAHSIGGDYYDFFPIQRGRWGIAIGDVSGKGIGAALIMASLRASVRANALHGHSDPSALMSQVNRLVYQSSPVNFFASLFYAEYEPLTRALAYVNAGHHPPIVIRCTAGRSTLLHLHHGGTPVGVFEDSRHLSTSVQLESGDLFLACTDGITEAESVDGELWGQQRLESLVSTCRPKTPKQVLQQVVREVCAFTAGAPQKDDMALVVMQVQK